MPTLPSRNFFIRLYRRGRRGYLHQQSTEQEPERNPDVQRRAKSPDTRREKPGDLRGRPVRPWISALGPSPPAPLQSNSRTSTAPSPAAGSQLCPGSPTVPRYLTPRLGTPLQTANGTHFDTARTLHDLTYRTRLRHGPW